MCVYWSDKNPHFTIATELNQPRIIVWARISSAEVVGPVFLFLLLVTRPLPRDGGMAENHGAPEAGQLSRVWTRGRRETESRQRVSGAKSP